MSEKLLVIDGHSMAFRAFYALPADSFIAAGGQHTNAVYGFLAMLTKLLETENPSHIVVAFDAGRRSFRTELYPEYKGTRDKTPPEFGGQVELLEATLSAMGVKTLKVENYEADDIIATLATRGRADGYHVLVASGDRDTFQLVNEDVTVLYPGRSASDLKYMTPQAVEERYGIAPEIYPDLAALEGETSDNLPGVPGVGPKTAAQWLKKFGNLDGLIENASKIGGKRGEALRDSLDQVRLNRKLNRLLTDMDLDLAPSDFVPETPDRDDLNSIFDTLEFGNLRNRIYKAFAPLWGTDSAQGGEETGTVQTTEDAAEEEEAEIVLVNEDADLGSYLESFEGQEVALWGVGRLAPTTPRLDLLTLAGKSLTLVIETTDLTPTQEKTLETFLAGHQKLIVHGGKALSHAARAQGWVLHEAAFDTELAAYICRPEQRGYALETLSTQYLEEERSVADEGALFSEDLMGDKGTAGTPLTGLQKTAATDVRTVYRLKRPLRAQLEEKKGLPLLEDLEIPVSTILGQMESDGIAMDRDKLETLRKEFRGEADTAASDAYAAIGHETNLGSPKQLQVVLFEELGMPKTRKTKTGWTTDAEALSDLYAKTSHPFLEALLRHRDRTKLLQMIDGLLGEIQEDGRIHTTFQQTVAATGRVASSDPNLQNIPVRNEAGLRIREAFIAGEGFSELMSVDYSQIEMRIMAHLSRDEDLIAAFNLGEDLHKSMASLVFQVPVEEVTGELRSRIKATSYGLAYGLSPFGLSRQLGSSVEEARELHKQYFERFGGVGRFLRDVVEQARVSGYTETMFGRRRYFPELTSSNRRLREMAERAALNAPIQGSAADLIKVAMITAARLLSEGGFRSRMLLQVHDELVLEIFPGEEDAVKEVVREAMSTSATLSVPLEVAVGQGHSWREAAH